jgi:hypothetical protein
MNLTQNPSEAIPWGSIPPRHQQKYQYPLLNHRLAALISALCSGVLFGSALHQGANSGTARIDFRFNILAPLARTLFLLIILIYARLWNAQRT